MGQVMDFVNPEEVKPEEVMKALQTEEVEQLTDDDSKNLRMYANLIWGRVQTNIVPRLIEGMNTTNTIDEFTPLVEAIVAEEADELITHFSDEFCRDIFTDIATREGLGYIADSPERYLKKSMIKEFIINFLRAITRIQLTVASNTLFSTIYQAAMKQKMEQEAVKEEALPEVGEAEAPSEPVDN